MGSLASMEQSKKHVVNIPVSDESVLRKKILELHAHDGNTFDTESLLPTIQAIINHVRNPGEPINHEISDLDIQPYLLHEITCVLKCKCSGGDGHATALEILQLLTNYTWEAKIVIILASFAVEYAQYHLIKTNSNSNSNSLAKIVATLTQIPDCDDIGDDGDIKSKVETIIRLLEFSMDMTRLIAKFGCLPPKHISIDVHHMSLAINQLPTAVYWITRLLVACSSDFTRIIYGYRQTQTSYTETWNITSLEEKITTIKTSLNAQLDLCNQYIEEKKHIKFVQKLKGILLSNKQQADNQKILQTMLVKKKDGSRPLSCGPDVTLELGVEALKGKTVLLLISSLEISHEEITKLSEFYKESRTNAKFQYEIVWLPIVEKSVTVEKIDKEFAELKTKMPWHTLVKPGMLKPGVARYAKEEWKYSKKSIMVALDQQGRVVNQNAFHTLWTWGNEVYPFSLKHELNLWNRKQWSLKLLVDEKQKNISTWIEEDKVICLYGGEKHEWINEMVTKTRQIQSEANINLEMVYIGKETSTERITKITEIVGDRSVCFDTKESNDFWKRIECMMYSKVHHGAKVKTEKEAGDPILKELLNMLTLGESDKGWAVISQGAGLGFGKIARGKGDVIVKALTEFKEWSVEVEKKSFVVALHEYLAGRPAIEHHCNRLILPGMDDIPEIVVCSECGLPMEKYIMYRCCTK